MRILGLHPGGHDAGACLIDGDSIVAIQEERLSRVKNDGRFPRASIERLLGPATIDSVDLVVLDVCDGATPRARAALAEMGYRGMISFVNHHRAHAAAAHAVSPEDGAAILVVDAAGTRPDEWPDDVPRPAGFEPAGRVDHEVQSFYVTRGRQLEPLHHTFARPELRLGIGWLWAVTTVYLGFGPLEAGKVMGLAAHAPPGDADDVIPWVSPGGDLLFDVDLDVSDPETWSAFCERLFGGIARREPGEPLEEGHAMVAARLQRTTERFLLQAADQLHRATRAATLCFSGGVALNVIANRVLQDQSPFDRVFVQPAASDSGIALGCALAGAIEQGAPIPAVDEFSFLGPPPDRGSLDRALAHARSLGFAVQPAVATLDDVLDLLSAGGVVGFVEGSSEAGPRALGHRSLLADPRDDAARTRVNERVKHREPFRPFAPIVLEEHAEEWFDLPFPSRTMLFSATVHEAKRSAIPAITHVDGTARVQTVPRHFPGRIRELLERFAERTGVPVLLNTSLNGPGEPLVETAEDAVRLFERSSMDALFVDGWWVTRTA